jgi:hypothetical protein
MTSYLIIPDSDIDPESPIDTSLETRYRDNLVASFEGDAPAPRLQLAAMQPPAAGTTYLLKTIQTVEAGTISSYPDTGLHDRYDSEQHLGFSCLLSGVVTVQLEQRTVSGGFGSTARTRLVKNQIEIVEWATSSTSFVLRSYDLSVDPGDAVVLQQIKAVVLGGDAAWRNLQVYSGTQSIAVA